MVASERLNAMNSKFKSPSATARWSLTFSFARAIQQPALEIWAGKDANRTAAQQALIHRAKCNARCAKAGSPRRWNRTEAEAVRADDRRSDSAYAALLFRHEEKPCAVGPDAGGTDLPLTTHGDEQARLLLGRRRVVFTCADEPRLRARNQRAFCRKQPTRRRT